MKFSLFSYFTLQAFGSGVAAWCGTEAVPSSAYSKLATIKGNESTFALQARSDTLEPITVEMFFHTVSSPDKENSIKDSLLSTQAEIITSILSKHNIMISYGGIASRTVDAYLSTFQYPLAHEERQKVNAFRESTRVGAYSTLNVYFFTDMSDGSWGSCNVAFENVTAQTLLDDGCNINANTLPGGLPGVDLGYTAVHEIGHWFGLLHTFMGYLCNGDGDLIDDTPYESEATTGCPIGKDSCPAAPGLDPIHNFMDYSSDDCYTEFTPGQAARMHSVFNQLRKGR